MEFATKAAEESVPEVVYPWKRNGNLVVLDASPAAFAPFGTDLLAGTRVRLNHDAWDVDATILGVKDGYLWRHDDGERGGGAFSSNNRKDLVQRYGFEVLPRVVPVPGLRHVFPGSQGANLRDDSSEDLLSEPPLDLLVSQAQKTLSKPLFPQREQRDDAAPKLPIRSYAPVSPRFKGLVPLDSVLVDYEGDRQAVLQASGTQYCTATSVLQVGTWFMIRRGKRAGTTGRVLGVLHGRLVYQPDSPDAFPRDFEASELRAPGHESIQVLVAEREIEQYPQETFVYRGSEFRTGSRAMYRTWRVLHGYRVVHRAGPRVGTVGIIIGTKADTLFEYNISTGTVEHFIAKHSAELRDFHGLVPVGSHWSFPDITAVQLPPRFRITATQDQRLQSVPSRSFDVRHGTCRPLGAHHGQTIKIVWGPSFGKTFRVVGESDGRLWAVDRDHVVSEVPRPLRRPTDPIDERDASVLVGRPTVPLFEPPPQPSAEHSYTCPAYNHEMITFDTNPATTKHFGFFAGQRVLYVDRRQFDAAQTVASEEPTLLPPCEGLSPDIRLASDLPPSWHAGVVLGVFMWELWVADERTNLAVPLPGSSAAELEHRMCVLSVGLRPLRPYLDAHLYPPVHGGLLSNPGVSGLVSGSATSGIVNIAYSNGSGFCAIRNEITLQAIECLRLIRVRRESGVELISVSRRLAHLREAGVIDLSVGSRFQHSTQPEARRVRQLVRGFREDSYEDAGVTRKGTIMGVHMGTVYVAYDDTPAPSSTNEEAPLCHALTTEEVQHLRPALASDSDDDTPSASLGSVLPSESAMERYLRKVGKRTNKRSTRNFALGEALPESVSETWRTQPRVEKVDPIADAQDRRELYPSFTVALLDQASVEASLCLAPSDLVLEAKHQLKCLPDALHFSAVEYMLGLYGLSLPDRASFHVACTFLAVIRGVFSQPHLRPPSIVQWHKIERVAFENDESHSRHTAELEQIECRRQLRYRLSILMQREVAHTAVLTPRDREPIVATTHFRPSRVVRLSLSAINTPPPASGLMSGGAAARLRAQSLAQLDDAVCPVPAMAPLPSLPMGRWPGVSATPSSSAAFGSAAFLEAHTAALAAVGVSPDWAFPYILSSGRTVVFDVSLRACMPRGAHFGQRFRLTRGDGAGEVVTVVGVCPEGQLWRYSDDGSEVLPFASRLWNENVTRHGLVDLRAPSNPRDVRCSDPFPFHTVDGVVQHFDVSPSALEPFGVRFGERYFVPLSDPGTPSTTATHDHRNVSLLTVIGEYEGQLWYATDFVGAMPYDGQAFVKDLGLTLAYTADVRSLSRYMTEALPRGTVERRCVVAPCAGRRGPRTFDVSREACAPFGVFPGQTFREVDPPPKSGGGFGGRQELRGLSTVVGVHQGRLYRYPGGERIAVPFDYESPRAFAQAYRAVKIVSWGRPRFSDVDFIGCAGAALRCSRFRFTSFTGGVCYFDQRPSMCSDIFGVRPGDVVRFVSGKVIKAAEQKGDEKGHGVTKQGVVVGVRDLLLWRVDEDSGAASMFAGAYHAADLARMYSAEVIGHRTLEEHTG